MHATADSAFAPSNLLALGAFLLAVAATGAVGSIASVSAAGFYAQLDRPAWAPPAWLFGPAWTVLYVMIALAGWLVWRRAGLSGASGAFVVYGVQLALNALWTWIFFVWRQGGWATFEIVLLWLAIAANVALFWRVRPLAGALLLPYLGWVSYAAALTIAVWRRNPAVL